MHIFHIYIYICKIKHTNFILSTYLINKYKRTMLNEDSYKYPPPRPAKWGIQFVPRSYAYVMERFGRYKKTLTQGIHFVIPFVDKIEYIHSLRVQFIGIPREPAITKDNISIFIDTIVGAKARIFDL